MDRNTAALDSNKKVYFYKGTQLFNGDLNDYCDEFQHAIKHFNIKSIAESLHNFQLAYESVSRNDVFHNKYASFCGLSRLINGDRGGLELCRESAHSELYDADVYLNLARAEWRLRNRKRTIVALKKGLNIDNRHAGILKMREQLGIRRHVVLSALDRSHAINVYLGKLKRKKTRLSLVDA